MLSSDQFWSFSCAHYEQQVVKEACLELQNEYHFNVNLLLLCCYLQGQQLRLDLTHIDQCLTAIAETHEQLNQVRIIRTEIKNTNELAYQYLLKAELALEQQQQSVLIETVNQQNLSPSSVRENITVYAQYLGLHDNRAVLSLLNLVNRT
jgi:uncharacterized protein (TIGR02444 family)